MRRGRVPGIVFLRYPGVPPVFSFGGRDVREPVPGRPARFPFFSGRDVRVPYEASASLRQCT